MQHDVFICHASEDKDELVRPLVKALQAEHIDVWYDEFSLRVGDSLRRSIDKGLAGARFGIVVLSPAFFRKSWTEWELNGLVSRMMKERRALILPVWHEVGQDEVIEYSAPLADIRALLSSDGIKSICDGLLSVIRPTVSPLHVAKEELSRLGWNPPPISDEWWLYIVERQSEWNWPIMETQPWLFPLDIGGHFGGHDKGLSIAWTALQLDWQEEARLLKVCQTTHPDRVFEFIDGNAALSEACKKHPETVANYAPQLLIPEFSGRFEKAFDQILEASIQETKSKPDNRFPEATCSRYVALRAENFGNNSAREVVDKWVNGKGSDYSARFHYLTDYLFWLLAKDSDWLPERVKYFLLQGMGELNPFRFDFMHDDVWADSLSKAIYMRSRRNLRWTKTLRMYLEADVAKSIHRLGLREDPKLIANAFIDMDLTGTWFDAEREMRMRSSKRRSKK